MMKTAPHELHDYISETAEHAGVSSGFPSAFGNPRNGAEE